MPGELTGLAEFDRVLGGGLVAGQVVLLAGEPVSTPAGTRMVMVRRVRTRPSPEHS